MIIDLLFSQVRWSDTVSSFISTAKKVDDPSEYSQELFIHISTAITPMDTRHWAKIA